MKGNALMRHVWERRDRQSEKIHLGKREIAVIALICIILASAVYYQWIFKRPLPGRKNIIGIIRIEGYILESTTVNRYITLINEALRNDSIKGVVLLIDSGGGYADYVEEIYSDLLTLRNSSKPLVASVIRALSGGYYIAVACDYIFVQNSSLVGSVGAIGLMPPILIPSERTIESGPYKWTGGPIFSGYSTLSSVVDNFISAVENGRGSRLKVSTTELRKAMVYLGREAIRLGLADEAGGLQDAINKVADEAKIVEYEIEELKLPERKSSSSSYSSNMSKLSPRWENITLETLSRIHPPPSVYYIYLPPQAISQSNVSSQIETSLPAGVGSVIIDVSHGNRVSWWTFDILISELAKRNMTVSFISQWEDLDSKLDNASCLIVASPIEVYSAEESKRIERFVEEGGLLLLFFDPAWEYIGMSGLLQGIITPINSLSTRFGFAFAKGYLYNEADHFGIYRNIYIREFAESPLTENLDSIVFFTATHIRSTNMGVAWTSKDTYSSIAERADNYTTIVFTERGNGTVAAFGDLTFLTEPYCYVADNYKLILNIASLISQVKVPVKEEVETGLEEEVARPDLPVGTEKNYTEWIDGKESLLRWFKVSETEVRIERPNRTTHYYFTEDGALWKWTADGMECIYENPLPEPPYPLTRGERWRYESNYTLRAGETVYYGNIAGEEEVKGFEDIMAGDNRYFCAKVEYKSVEYLLIDGRNMTMITTGYYWISSEAGTVKQETTTSYYVDGILTSRETRTLILRSIRKG